jgi:hypothetical protein
MLIILSKNRRLADLIVLKNRRKNIICLEYQAQSRCLSLLATLVLQSLESAKSAQSAD